MADSLYEYSLGNRLIKRNTYFYSEYAGEPFLTAYFNDRKLASAEFSLPDVEINLKKNPDCIAWADLKLSEVFESNQLFASLINELENGRYSETKVVLHALVQRFEVTKRVYQHYNKELRAEDKSKFQEISSYLDFAELVAIAYNVTEKLPFLNALLKVIDTIIAMVRLNEEVDKHRLSWLISFEQNRVARLLDKHLRLSL